MGDDVTGDIGFLMIDGLGLHFLYIVLDCTLLIVAHSLFFWTFFLFFFFFYTYKGQSLFTILCIFTLLIFLLIFWTIFLWFYLVDTSAAGHSLI